MGVDHNKDGHFTDQCRYLGKNKCRDCGRFGHEPGSCDQQNTQSGGQNAQSNNNKQRGRYYGPNSNKRGRREAQNATDDNTQSANVVTHGQWVALNAIAPDEYDNDDDDEYNSYNNVAISSQYSDRQLYDWLADSGTTSHITHRRDTFVTYESIPKTQISGVGGITTFAIGRGSILLHSECDGNIHTLQLSNVLHVPSNQNSLLSLGCWEERTGRSILIKDGKMTLYTRDGIPVAKGIRLLNKLYQMSFTIAPASTTAITSFNATTSAPSWETWHKRFGHVGYSGLQKLLDKNLVNGLHVNLTSEKVDCVVCIEAKMSEAPYGPTKKSIPV